MMQCDSSEDPSALSEGRGDFRRSHTSILVWRRWCKYTSSSFFLSLIATVIEFSGMFSFPAGDPCNGLTAPK